MSRFVKLMAMAAIGIGLSTVVEPTKAQAQYVAYYGPGFGVSSYAVGPYGYGYGYNPYYTSFYRSSMYPGYAYSSGYGAYGGYGGYSGYGAYGYGGYPAFYGARYWPSVYSGYSYSAGYRPWGGYYGGYGGRRCW